MKTLSNSNLNSIILLPIYSAKTNTPVTHSEIQQYLSSSDDWQISDQEDISPAVPVYKRLGWTATESSNYTDKRNEWEKLYAKYNNVNTCTKVVKDAVAKFIVDFHAFARPYLKKITSCGTALQVDADVFHVVLERKKPSHAHTQIKESITGSFSNRAPGKWDVWAKWDEEAKKASLPEGASHVEYSWYILPLNEKGEVEISPSVKIMTAPNDDFKTKLSTKAKFIMDLKAEYSGRYAIIFLRWFVDFNESLSSEYSIAYLNKIP
jgi:hypothetical protein